jgi:hypothetical protein
VAGVDCSEAVMIVIGLKTAHAKDESDMIGKNQKGLCMNAKKAVEAVERTKEKNISLHLPSRFDNVLAGTRVRSDIIEGRAIINPSWKVVAFNSTMYIGRNGLVIAFPSM